MLDRDPKRNPSVPSRRATASEIRRMQVAPYDACVRCMKGDVDTGLAARGEAEWIIAAAMHLVGDREEGTAMAIASFKERGAPPGEVPSGTLTEAFRLCPECASELDVEVCDLSGAVYVYAPKKERGGT